MSEIEVKTFDDAMIASWCDGFALYENCLEYRLGWLLSF